EKAKKRNAGFIGMGLSKFLVSDFSKTEFPDSFFDSIIAFNVNFFWKSLEHELKIIRQLLKRDGKLVVLYQAPFDINIKAAEPIKQNLLANSFQIVDVQLKKLVPTSAFCIISKPE
ncbi:MAG TPA: methyltransferase domain-containing protein, partial [Sphingobacteriaceae bacterium]